MKKALMAFVVAFLFVACANHEGTLKAARNDFAQLRKELSAGELKVVKYGDEKKNSVATQDWIDIADLAIENIDRALGVAPVTSESR